MPRILALWTKLHDKPLGSWLFGKLVCWKAPYFATIKPRFEELKPGYARVSMKKRHAVHNHIGTVHAIAMCNLAELGAGTMMEASLPRSMRWLPRGMQVRYLKKAETDLVAECLAADIADGPARDVTVNCAIRDRHGSIVCQVDVVMYLSPRKPTVEPA
ncbi:MAG TPA: hotdog fold domain-containing protein [Usitatibacteraceae bacterium]